MRRWRAQTIRGEPDLAAINLISCVRNCDGLASGELIERVMASADAFAAGAKQHDDMTLIVARLLYS